MRKTTFALRLALAPAALGLAFGAADAPVLAQAADAPRSSGHAVLDELPDWTGVWYPDWSSLFGPNGRSTPQLTPAAQAELDRFLADQAEGKNVQTEDANCVPPGMPRIMQMPYPIEILFSPGRVNILTETYSQVRRIYTDGRTLPEEPDWLFNGTSVGRWDGDVLLVETIGFSPQTTIATGVGHGENLRISERIYLENPDRLIVEMTLTDPDVLARPHVIRQAFDKRPDWEIREYVCQENNRDAADAEGRALMDLGLEDVFGPLEE